MSETKTLENALSVMSFLTDKAEERDFLKRIPVQLSCTVLSESAERFYKSGPKMGQLRGHQVNLVTDSGAILPDILLNEPVGRGEQVAVEVELLIPDSFLSGKILVQKVTTDPPHGTRTNGPRTTPPSSPEVKP